MEGEACPTGEVFNCDPACGDTEGACNTQFAAIDRGLHDTDYVLRTNPDTRLLADCDTRSGVALDQGSSTLRVTAPPPWSVAAVTGEDPCTVTGAAQCVVGDASEYIIIFTDDPEAMPANVTVEYVESDATCP